MTTVSVDDAFRVDAIVEEARRLEPDGGEPFAFLDGLEALCDSLEREAGCSPQGRLATHNGLVHGLVTQARVRRNLREHPEIAAQPVGRPVFVIGLPRTGTTFIHNALAQHPGLRCPNLWELRNPAGPRDPTTYEAAADAAQAYVEWYYASAPRMRIVHPMDARRPDECQRLLSAAFRTPIYWLRHRVPGYADWLERQDLTPAYAYHRAQLQHILWRIPGAVPVLKDPFHIWFLPALVRAYPEARFVHLHRDPAVSVPSTCSLSEICRGATSDRVDRREVGRFWLARIERALARLPEVRREHLAGKDVLDIRYPELTGDRLGTIARICDFIGVPLDDEAARRVRAFLAADPLKQHGAHEYSAEDFGLDRDELGARFAAYRREYGL